METLCPYTATTPAINMLDKQFGRILDHIYWSSIKHLNKGSCLKLLPLSLIKARLNKVKLIWLLEFTLSGINAISLKHIDIFLIISFGNSNPYKGEASQAWLQWICPFGGLNLMSCKCSCSPLCAFNNLMELWSTHASLMLHGGWLLQEWCIKKSYSYAFIGSSLLLIIHL